MGMLVKVSLNPSEVRVTHNLTYNIKTFIYLSESNIKTVSKSASFRKSLPTTVAVSAD